jgi:hypothetical protein
MSLGKRTIQSVSVKQKINTRSSTEAELLDEIISGSSRLPYQTELYFQRQPKQHEAGRERQGQFGQAYETLQH